MSPDVGRLEDDGVTRGGGRWRLMSNVTDEEISRKYADDMVRWVPRWMPAVESHSPPPTIRRSNRDWGLSWP